MDTVWLAIGIQTIAMLTVLISGYTRLIVRLSIIESQLSDERTRRTEKVTARQDAIELALARHCPKCQADCPARKEHMSGVITMPGVST